MWGFFFKSAKDQKRDRKSFPRRVLSSRTLFMPVSLRSVIHLQEHLGIIEARLALEHHANGDGVDYLSPWSVDCFKRAPKSAKKRIEQKADNELDPITLEPIDSELLFVLNGMRYNIISLMLYYQNCSDHFRDPMDGAKILTQEDVARIDGCYAILSSSSSTSTGSLPKLPLLSEKKTSEKGLSDIKSQIKNWDSILGDIIAGIYDLLESDANKTIVDFDFQVSMILSELLFPFEEFKKLDAENAILALSGYRSFLKGSTKKPTKDPNQRLESLVFPVLDTLLTEKDREMQKRSRSSSWDEGFLPARDI